MTRLETIRRDRRIFRTDIVRLTSQMYGAKGKVGESTIYEAEKKKKSPNVQTMRKIQTAINTLTKGKFPPVTLDELCEDEAGAAAI